MAPNMGCMNPIIGSTMAVAKTGRVSTADHLSRESQASNSALRSWALRDLQASDQNTVSYIILSSRGAQLQQPISLKEQFA